MLFDPRTVADPRHEEQDRESNCPGAPSSFLSSCMHPPCLIQDHRAKKRGSTPGCTAAVLTQRSPLHEGSLTHPSSSRDRTWFESEDCKVSGRRRTSLEFS
ncbi:unnamed protein product [Choristocarpus tenellus]